MNFLTNALEQKSFIALVDKIGVGDLGTMGTDMGHMAFNYLSANPGVVNQLPQLLGGFLNSNNMANMFGNQGFGGLAANNYGGGYGYNQGFGGGYGMQQPGFGGQGFGGGYGMPGYGGQGFGGGYGGGYNNFGPRYLSGGYSGYY